MKRLAAFMLVISTTFFSNISIAEEWCTLQEGFTVTSNGMKTNQVFINGFLEGEANNRWILIANDSIGKANISIALTAQASGRPLSIYLSEDSMRCNNMPNWYEGIHHVRLN